MMYRPATTSAQTSLKHGLATRLAVPKIARNLVRQPVNLRPQGNTISLTVPAEMPFMMSGPMTVVTQASGGMAKPDPRMRSTRLLSNSMAGVRGLGGLGGVLEDTAYAWFQQYDGDAANMTREQYDADPGKTSYWQAAVAKANPSLAPAAPAAPIDWANIAKTTAGVLTAATPIASTLITASKTNPGGFMPGMTQAAKNLVTPPAKSNTMLYVGLGAAALAIAAFFLLRKKSAAV